MNIGFTGTQEGMTMGQSFTLERLLKAVLSHEEVTEVHHGDCIGADKEFHDLAVIYGLKDKIVIHPPKNSRARAFCESEQVREPKDYMVRNQNIVDESEIIFATPLNDEASSPRSGTWATIRRSRDKEFNTTVVILSNGDTL